MSVIPRTVIGKIEFCEAHLAVWAANPTAIGITALQVSDLAALVAQARADYDAAEAARNGARSAIETRNISVGSMFDLVADLVKTIRAFAETTNDPSVYPAADIPAPAAPTPTPPPDAPTNLTAMVNTVGHCLLNWKGSRAVGTQFVLRRQVTPVGGTPGQWTYAGSSVTNDYTDTTVPTGLASVSYVVIAQRASGTSEPSNTATLTFGTGTGEGSGSGGLTLAA